MQTKQFLKTSLVFAMCGMGSAYAVVVDHEAAMNLMMRKNDNYCLACHAMDRDKGGPSFKSISEKYRGKSIGEERVIRAITTPGFKVKNSDGQMVEHVVNLLDKSDPKDNLGRHFGELKNLAAWILSL